MFLLLIASLLAHADEGMWLPEQIPDIAAEWTERGLELDPAQLSDPLGQPLGSIVSTGGCSASFVSPNGLVATNHHCVRRYLQFVSDPDNDHLADGFAARHRAEERSVGPTGRLRVVDRITDVTAEIFGGLRKRASDRQRRDHIDSKIKALTATCEEEPGRRCYVAGYFGSSSYRLVRTLEIRDVRIVWAPPAGIGNFGGDVDNWMWPRHTGDFSFIRAYVAPDGSAADFHESNVPYQPPHHLEINPQGVGPGDFVMVAGYPGRTERHELLVELTDDFEDELPDNLALTRKVEAILQEEAESDPEARIRLAPILSSLANSAKNTEGLLDGYGRRDARSRKAAEEEAFLTWIRADRRRAKELLGVYEELIAAHQEAKADDDVMRVLSRVRRWADFAGVAHTALRWAQERAKADADRDRGLQDRDGDRIKARFRRMDRSLWLPADRRLLRVALEQLQALHHPPASLRAWLTDAGGIDAALATLFAHTDLSDVQARLSLLEQTPQQLAGSDNPWVQLAIALERDLAPKRERAKSDAGRRQRLRSAWVSAKRDWFTGTGHTMYDDANGTLRLTLGHVEGYSPQDGMQALPQTRLQGVVAKATGVEPFDAPASLLERAAESSGSRWVDPALGDVPINLLTTLDVTGGNSGSAVLDGQGRLIGLAFDTTFEGIIGDRVFYEDLNRTIVVDIRYILWVLEGDARAASLLAELGVSGAE